LDGVIEELLEAHHIPLMALARRGAGIMEHPEVHEGLHRALPEHVLRAGAAEVELVMQHVLRPVRERAPVDADDLRAAVELTREQLPEAPTDAGDDDAGLAQLVVEQRRREHARLGRREVLGPRAKLYRLHAL